MLTITVKERNMKREREREREREIERVCRVAGGLIDDEQDGFRERRACLDQIFTL